MTEEIDDISDVSLTLYIDCAHHVAPLLLVGARCTISPEAGRPEGQSRVQPPSSPTLNETGNNSAVKGDIMGVQGKNNIISILLITTVETIVDASIRVKLNLTQKLLVKATFVRKQIFSASSPHPTNQQHFLVASLLFHEHFELMSK